MRIYFEVEWSYDACPTVITISSRPIEADSEWGCVYYYDDDSYALNIDTDFEEYCTPYDGITYSIDDYYKHGDVIYIEGEEEDGWNDDIWLGQKIREYKKGELIKEYYSEEVD